MFRRKKPEGEETMTENEPTPETLVAPLAKPAPRPATPGLIMSGSGISTSVNSPAGSASMTGSGTTGSGPNGPGSAPNRIPTMPPRPSPTELTRAGDPTKPAEPVRFGDYNRPAPPPELPRKPAEPARAAAPEREPEPEPVPPPVRSARQEAEVRQLIVGREISLKGEITHCDRLLIEGSVEANLSDCRDVEIAESGLFKGEAGIESAEIHGRFEGTLTVRKRLFIRATGIVTGTIRYGQIEIERGGRIAGDIQATLDAPGEVIPSRFG
jgi:cytoskeletal protein CcmA (bactofilin family)